MTAHPFFIKAPAILNDTRNLISSPDNERSNSLAAIKESVAAIEAFMNEIGEIGNGYERHGHPQSHPLVMLGRRLREAENSRKSVKNKIMVAYECLAGKRLSKGNTRCYQRFGLVVDVRNGLSHPKASGLAISDRGVLLSKKDRNLIQGLRSNGFGPAKGIVYDWNELVCNRKFALWSYQAAIDIINLVLRYWPHPQAVESYRDLYSVHLRNPENWPDNKVNKDISR